MVLCVAPLAQRGGGGGGGGGGAPMALERRLRPLYEALDAGNPKLALKHAQQGLKKSPGEPQLLALKGAPCACTRASPPHSPALLVPL